MKNKNIEKKFLPEGFRYLKEGEPIKQGDYFWGDENNYMYTLRWYSGIDEHKNNKWNKIRDTANTSNWVKEHVIRKDDA
jgi:hypothetical protein